jgi:hypothetical protein
VTNNPNVSTETIGIDAGTNKIDTKQSGGRNSNGHGLEKVLKQLISAPNTPKVVYWLLFFAAEGN